MGELTHRQFVKILGLYAGTAALSIVVSIPTSPHKTKVKQYNNPMYKDTTAGMKQHLREFR